jgi:flavin-dependent dehydrogenase
VTENSGGSETIATTATDVLVIGGGPAGSTAATLLARHGHSVRLLERERFPRFQIGESLLPYNNDVFRRLGIVEELKSRFVLKYAGEFVTADRSAATIFRFDRWLDEPYKHAYQVKRADFDALLLRTAREAGVDVREQTQVARINLDDPERVQVETAGGETFTARFLVDASGHNSFLGQRLGGKKEVADLKKIATFAHFRGVPRAEGKDGGNIVIIVLRGGWFWMIPLPDDVMSVGLVADRDHVVQCGLEPEELLMQTIAATPYVAERMVNAERISQVYRRKDFSYRMERVVGPNFALVGDAAGFLDPIFSTGVCVATTSASILADALHVRLTKGDMRPLRRYERKVQRAISRYFQFIANFYRREFMEVLLHPDPMWTIYRAVVGMLGGNVFAVKKDMWLLRVFFFLVRLQKWSGAVAPRIAWNALPAPAWSGARDANV